MTDRTHFQGYIELEHKHRMVWVKNRFGHSINMQPVMTTTTQAVKYTCKVKTSLSEFVYWGKDGYTPILDGIKGVHPFDVVMIGGMNDFRLRHFILHVSIE